MGGRRALVREWQNSSGVWDEPSCSPITALLSAEHKEKKQIVSLPGCGDVSLEVLPLCSSLHQPRAEAVGTAEGQSL